jgi:hypothetical protein
VSVPHNRDVEVFLREKWGDRFYQLMDKYETVNARQAEQVKRYDERVERQEQAKMRLKPGSNEPFKEGWTGQMDRRTVEDDAADFQINMFETRVRVWWGDYGPDQEGLFHSGECARQWANQVAGRLREQGKI